MTPRDASGYTLVELVVAIAVSILIVAPITGAIIIGLRTTDSSSQRLSQTRDIELVQGVLPRDVFTATSVQANVAAASTCAGKLSLLRLTWSTPTLNSGSGPPTTTLQNWEVDYFYALNPVAPPAPQTGSLTRQLYTGSAPSCMLYTGNSSTLLATSLSAAAPTVALSGTTVKLTLTDSSGAKFAACAHMRTPATTTTGASSTTLAPTCSG